MQFGCRVGARLKPESRPEIGGALYGNQHHLANLLGLRLLQGGGKQGRCNAFSPVLGGNGQVVQIKALGLPDQGE